MKEFRISLPASSANLGPAFDAAALALDLALSIRARKAERFSILARGRDSDICGRVENHLILNTYREVLQSEKKAAPALALVIENAFPIGKGFGSSAAARLAGIALAVHFGNLRWDSPRIIYEASIREHHPDNAAACWLGGVTVARMVGGNARLTHIARILPKGDWPLMLAVPASSLSTEKARAVLPNQYSRTDVVANIQSSMLLLAAFVQGSHQLLASSLEDRIHQPYRAPLCPLLPALEDLSPSVGVLGVALSGAGPSVLIFLDPARSLSRTKAKIQARLNEHGLKAELMSTAIRPRGGAATFFRKR